MPETLARLFAMHERWFDHYFSLADILTMDADLREYRYHTDASSALYYLIHDRKWGYEQ